MQNTLGLFGYSGGGEIILVIVVILLLFGAKRLPDLARSLGKSLGEFKKGREEGEKQDKPDGEGKQDPDGGGAGQS